ncbi:hypothetical protein [Noviherbaspirillum massiliense]|uniref:hypothetical protein n=1 Tax=Noviherbaspirillum massiliense TaxID=1465823 RepID=UPI00055960E9|nr:hypothetical protein [Noviherbaspirillum massiliense]
MKQQDQTTYNPNHLFDALIERMGLSNDGALARKLKIARSLINEIRKGQRPVAGSLLLWIQEATGITVNELRMLMGDRRRKYRLSYAIT